MGPSFYLARASKTCERTEVPPLRRSGHTGQRARASSAFGVCDPVPPCDLGCAQQQSRPYKCVTGYNHILIGVYLVGAHLATGTKKRIYIIHVCTPASSSRGALHGCSNVCEFPSTLPRKNSQTRLPEKNGYFPICISGSFFLVAPRNYESHLTCKGLNQFLTKGLKARRTMERRAPSKCSVGTSALNGLCVETAGCL